LSVIDPSSRPLGAPDDGTLTRRIVASLLWLSSARLLGQVGSWLSTALVIRLLSPDDYGLMSMAGLLMFFLLVIGDLGLGAVVVQTPTLHRAQLRSLFGISLATSLLSGIVTFLAAPLVAAFFAEPRLVPLVRVLSLCFVFVGLYALPQALLVRTLRFDRKAKVDMATTLGSSVLALILAATGRGVWALVGSVLAFHVIRAVAFQIAHPCLFLPSLALTELRHTLRFGGWITLDRLLWFAFTSLDVAIAGRALGGVLVGLYSVALSLASIPVDKVMAIVNEVSFSAFSRIQDDRERLRRGVLRALETVSLLAFPTFLGMAMVAPEVVHVGLGPQWADAVLPMQILCLVMPFRAIGSLFAPALFASGQPRRGVENSAIRLGGVAVALSLGVQWGVIGLCVGWLVGYVPVFCVTARRTLATLEIPAQRAVRTMAFSVAAALTMAAAVGSVRAVVGESWPPGAVLVILSLVGAGTYGLVVVAFRPRMLQAFWIRRVSAG